MTRVALAVGSNGSRSLASLDDMRPLTSITGVHVVLMSRPDITVHVIELPAVGPQEVGGFLAFKARSLYPGHPGETAFDYRLLRWGGRRYAVLFLVRRQVLDENRRVAGGRPLLAACALLVALVRRARPGRTTVGMVWHPGWIEALVLAPGAQPRAILLARAGGIREDLARLADELPAPAPVDWRVAAVGAELAALREALAQLPEGPASAVVTPLERLLARQGRRPRSLFAPRRRGAVVPRRVRVPLGLAALALLAWLGLKSAADREAASAALLGRAVHDEQARAQVSQGLRRELDGLEAEVARLGAARPPDPGAVLSALVDVLGPGTRLQSLSLENGSFQLEAAGTNPLRLMERLASSGVFADVRLLQIVPLPGTPEELFRVTGRVR